MTNEEKQLLIKDLCARLPYKPHIKFSIIGAGGYEVCELLPELITSIFLNEDIEIKPYLRPMSSMTEEERKKLSSIQEKNTPYPSVKYRGCDYLNSIHVDYRGLIEKGLALEAPEGMYKYGYI